MGPIDLFLRALGALSLVPLGIGNRSIPRRIALAALLATVLWNGDLVAVNLVINPLSLVLNFILGFTLVLPLALTARTATVIGELFDLGRGQSIGQIYDPTTTIQSGLSGVFLGNWVWLLILGLGGLDQLVFALSKSVMIIPEASQLISQASGQHLVALLAQILGSAIALCALCLILFIIVEVVVALLAKILPQLSSQSISYQIKSGLGLLAIVTLLQSDYSAEVVRTSVSNGIQFTLDFFAGLRGRGQGI